MSHRDTMSRYFAAVNTEDWVALEALLHAEVTFQTPGTPARTGRDDVLALYRRLFKAWTTHVDDPVRVFVEDDHVIAEVEFSGTSTSGRDIGFSAVDVVSLDGDLIRSLTTYYDLDAVRRDLAAPTGATQ